jgi:hypothetical protein
MALAMCSCAHRAERASGVSRAVLQSWASERSYYALVEIVDAFIDPTVHRATKQQVEELLGSQRDEGHPGASPDCWIYSSSRRVRRESCLCIYFDERGTVKEVDWISE